MKKLVLVFILFPILLSCKEESLIPDGYTGNAEALKNGEKWEALVRFAKNKPFDISYVVIMDIYNSQGFNRETLYFYKVQNHFNPQTIFLTSNRTANDSTGSRYFTSIDDGDVGGEYYLKSASYKF